MADETANNLVFAWITHQDTFWAFEELHEIVARSHDEAWPIVLEIAENTASDAALGALAVGPMEHMLCSYGNNYYEFVKIASEKCFSFKRALTMGIRITGPESEKISELILEIQKEAVKDGWHSSL